MKSTPYHLFANYTLSVIPLFILMGAFAERSGLARDMFAAARAVVGHLRGGLAYVGDRRLHGLRRDLRLVGRDHRDLRRAPRCPSCAATATSRASRPARSRSAAWSIC